MCTTFYVQGYLRHRFITRNKSTTSSPISKRYTISDTAFVQHSFSEFVKISFNCQQVNCPWFILLVNLLLSCAAVSTSREWSELITFNQLLRVLISRYLHSICRCSDVKAEIITFLTGKAEDIRRRAEADPLPWSRSCLLCTKVNSPL